MFKPDEFRSFCKISVLMTFTTWIEQAENKVWPLFLAKFTSLPKIDLQLCCVWMQQQLISSNQWSLVLLLSLVVLDDAQLKQAYQAREESDEEGADNSVEVVPITLREARAAVQKLKIFVQENQDVAAVQPY